MYVKLDKKDVLEAIDIIKVLENGLPGIKTKVVKAGSYDVVIPAGDLELKKGDIAVFVQLKPNMWLLLVNYKNDE